MLNSSVENSDSAPSSPSLPTSLPFITKRHNRNAEDNLHDPSPLLAKTIEHVIRPGKASFQGISEVDATPCNLTHSGSSTSPNMKEKQGEHSHTGVLEAYEINHDKLSVLPTQLDEALPAFPPSHARQQGHRELQDRRIGNCIELRNSGGLTYNFYPSTNFCELAGEHALISGGSLLAAEKKISALCKVCGEISRKAQIDNPLDTYIEDDEEFEKEDHDEETSTDGASIPTMPVMGENPVLEKYMETAMDSD